MVECIRKRDGSIEKFCAEKITDAIFKAATACGGSDYTLAEKLSDQVVQLAEERSSISPVGGRTRRSKGFSSRTTRCSFGLYPVGE